MENEEMNQNNNSFSISNQDNKTILTLASSSKDPSNAFALFQEKHPELLISQIIGSEKDSSTNTYLYKFETRKNSSGIAHQKLFYTDSPKLMNMAIQNVQSSFKPDGEYYYTPLRVIQPKDSNLGLLVIENGETRENYNQVTVPPTSDIREYLKRHPNMRLVGIANYGINGIPVGHASNTYQRNYNITAIFASILDFPELGKIQAQEVHSLIDMPSNKVESQKESILKKMNRPDEKNHSPNFVEAQQVYLGNVFLDQEDENGHCPITVNGETRILAGKCEEIFFIFNSYKEPEKAITSPSENPSPAEFGSL